MRLSRSERTEFARQFIGYWNGLPPQQQGVILIGLWLNAVFTVLLESIVTGRLGLLVVRAWRRRQAGAAGATRGVDRPGLVGVVVLAVHALLRRRFVAGVRRRVAQHTAASPGTGPSRR